MLKPLRSLPAAAAAGAAGAVGLAGIAVAVCLVLVRGASVGLLSAVAHAEDGC